MTLECLECRIVDKPQNYDYNGVKLSIYGCKPHADTLYRMLLGNE